MGMGMGMGMLDAISLLHLRIFAGYMTATIILMAVNIATSQAIVLSGLPAFAPPSPAGLASGPYEYSLKPFLPVQTKQGPP